ncbi:hypothetical protein MY11210_006511 [Beauveria gryllotalpidicola]
MDEIESLGDDEPPQETGRRGLRKKTVYFRFRSRIIGATGKQSDWHHPNVLRLSIHATAASSIVSALLRWLPSRLSSWLAAQFPEWALPTNIVLKKAKDGWESEFSTELATYTKLKSLQGQVIPLCYGEIEYDGARALVMSDIGGACVADPEGAVLTEPELEPLLHAALSALANYGIIHDDTKLDNFHLVDRGQTREVMIVDLERVEESSSREELDLSVTSSVSFLMENYHSHLDCLRHDGLLRIPWAEVERSRAARRRRPRPAGMVLPDKLCDEMAFDSKPADIEDIGSATEMPISQRNTSNIVP